jgi:hypothetical protein
VAGGLSRREWSGTSLDINEQLTAFNRHRKSPQWDRAGQRTGLAVADIESTFVPRAFDDITVEIALFAERGGAVSTEVLAAVKLVRDPVYDELRQARYLDPKHFARLYLLGTAESKMTADVSHGESHRRNYALVCQLTIMMATAAALFLASEDASF